MLLMVMKQGMARLGITDGRGLGLQSQAVLDACTWMLLNAANAMLYACGCAEHLLRAHMHSYLQVCILCAGDEVVECPLTAGLYSSHEGHQHTHSHSTSRGASHQPLTIHIPTTP